MIPGGGDLSGLLAQAQAMQAQLAQAQQELADATVEGSAGGGLVKATVTGNGELVGLEIAAEACDPDDTESLADLVVAAVRDATSKSHEIAAQKMPQLPEGMGLPEGLGGGLPF